MLANNTCEKILNESIKLFAKQGYEKTTMVEIGEAVGIKSASIYYHFPAKYDIMLGILELYSQHLRGKEIVYPEITKPPTAEELLAIMFYAFSEEHQERNRLIQKIIYAEQMYNDEISAFLQREIVDCSYRYIKAILNNLMERKLIPTTDVDKISSTISSMLIGYTILNTMNRTQMEIGNEKTEMFALILYLLEIVLKGAA